VICHFHRLTQLKPLTPQPVVLDGTRPLPFSRTFEPHTGGRSLLGTDPAQSDRRLKPDDLDDLQAASPPCSPTRSPLLAPGGLLVYSTARSKPRKTSGVDRGVSLPAW